MADEIQSEEEPSIEEILDSIRQIISEDEEEGVEVSADSESEKSKVSDSEGDEEPEQRVIEDGPEEVEYDEPSDEGSDEDFAQILESSDKDSSEVDEEEEPFELTDLVSEEPDKFEVDLVEDSSDEEGVVDESDNIVDDALSETVEEPISEPEPAEEPEVTDTVEVDLIDEIETKADDNAPYDIMSETEALLEEGTDVLTDQAKEAAYTAMAALVKKTAVDSTHAVTLEDIVREELKPLLRAWLDKHLATVIERLVREELERVSKRVLDE